MTFLSYAQNYEDVRLWRAFRDVEKGRYIDVGGQDPVRDSVSLAFYERGWRGIHVEPTPTYAEALRNARPEETVFEAAVTTAPGPIRFFDIPTTGLSTGIAEIAEKHGSVGWDYREILVPAVTLAGLLESYGPELVHWLKIDVEGMEADVIASWGDHPARPAVLVIEATAPMTQTKTHWAWRQMVLDRGYNDVVFDGLSQFFVHKDHKRLREAIAESPNVFDGFHVSDAHFTAAKLVNDRHEAVAAVSADLQSRLDAAEAAASAELARLQAEHEVDQNHLAETQGALSATSKRLAETEDALRTTSQRLAVSEGALGETSRQLSDVEAVLGDTSQRLVKTETALSLTAAREAAAENRRVEAQGRLDALQNEHGQLLKEAGQLQGRLEASAKAYADRLAATTARLDRAEQEWLSASAELASAQNEIARLSSVQANLERRLERASALLASTPEPVKDLSAWRGTLIGWLMPSSSMAAFADYASAVGKFQAGEILPVNSDIGQGDALPIALEAQLPIGDLTHGDLRMVERDEPITTMPRLLEPHDRDFILAAYQVVLGRGPDPEGERHYLARLRAGAHKLAILRELRRSREGRAFIPGVAGLDRAIKRHHWATRPLIGMLIRLIFGGEGDSRDDRRFRALANELGQIKQQQAKLEMEASVKSNARRAPTDLSRGAKTAQDQLVKDRGVDEVRFQPTFIPNEQNLYTANEFMQLHDTRFVEAAYLAILHREPDASGFRHYVTKVREGSSKLRILSGLIRSEEGRSKGTVITGLDSAYVIERVLNAPVIGSILHFLLFSVSIKDHLRDLRALENHLVRIAEQSHALHRQEIDRLEKIIEDEL